MSLLEGEKKILLLLAFQAIGVLEQWSEEEAEQSAG